MTDHIALLGRTESGLADRLAARLACDGVGARVLSLEAPVDGAPVTIRGRRVVWEGVDLTAARAVFVETAVYPWPQPHRLVFRPDADAESLARGASIDRETRALLVSALRVAADAVPMLDPPCSAHLAVNPAVALDVLEAAGFDVVPRTFAAPWFPDSFPGVAIDPAGRDLSHTPSPPRPGDTALVLSPPEGEVTTCLVVGDTVVGRVHHATVGDWADRANGAVLAGIAGAAPSAAATDDPPASDPADTLAVRAAAALGVGRLALAIAGPPAHPILIHAGTAPDLDAWDAVLDGVVVEGLARHITDSVSHSSSVNPGDPR